MIKKDTGFALMTSAIVIIKYQIKKNEHKCIHRKSKYKSFQKFTRVNYFDMRLEQK